MTHKYESVSIECATREEAKKVLGAMIDGTPGFSGKLYFVRYSGQNIIVACTGAGEASDINAMHLCALLNQEQNT